MTDFMPEIIITGEQIKAARAMLRLDQKRFSELCHVSYAMIRRMEKTNGPISTDSAILKAMEYTLESVGIELISAGYYEGNGGPGIRMKGEPVISNEVVDLAEASEIITDKKVEATVKEAS